jgi:hypothetical protein
VLWYFGWLPELMEQSRTCTQHVIRGADQSIFSKVK